MFLKPINVTIKRQTFCFIMQNALFILLQRYRICIERGKFLTLLNKRSMFVCICTINEKVKIVVRALHYHFVNETILIVFHSVLNPTTSFSFQTVYSDNSRSVSSTVSKHCNTTPPGLNHHHSVAL